MSSSSNNHNNPKIETMLKHGNTYLTDIHKVLGADFIHGDLPLTIEKGLPPNPSVATFNDKQVGIMAKEQFEKVKKNAKRKGIIKDSEGKTIPLDETLSNVVDDFIQLVSGYWSFWEQGTMTIQAPCYSYINVKNRLR